LAGLLRKIPRRIAGRRIQRSFIVILYCYKGLLFGRLEETSSVWGEFRAERARSGGIHPAQIDLGFIFIMIQ
jgi:hypothetical protein